MSRWHAEIWSHPGHYLVDAYTWPWSPNGHQMVMNDLLPTSLFNVNRPSYSEITVIHGQGYVLGPRSMSNLTLKIQRSKWWPRSNLILTLEVFSSIDVFAFRFPAIGPFWLRHSKFRVWPWKFRVRIMAKVKHDCHIWGLKFNRYVCFSFRGNRTSLTCNIAFSIFALEKSRSRSQRKTTKI